MLYNNKVLLIHPSIIREEMYGIFNELVVREVPISVGFLAGYLLEKGIEVKIVDEQYERLSHEKIKEIIEEFQPRIVGISCITPVIFRAFELSESIKKISKDITIILGNIHPTVLPEESLKKQFVDIVIRGEGEVTLWECVQLMEGKKKIEDILGISYKNNRAIIHNPERPFEKNLDKFPRIAYELVYKSMLMPVDLGVIITSRGCPHKCIFCASRNISGHFYRMNSVQRVIEDIEFLVNKYGIKTLRIADDNFLVNKKRVKDICRILIQKNIHKKLKWNCQACVDTIDENILYVMKQAGCERIAIGFESGVQRLLDIINKNQKVENGIKAVELMKKTRLYAKGMFILGIPTETRQETIKTIEYARSLPLDIAKFGLATPYPGTEFYNIAIKEGMEEKQDWSKLTTMTGITDIEPPYVPMGRSPKEMKSLQLKAYLRFYLRPKQLLIILKGKNPDLMVLPYKDIIKYLKQIIKYTIVIFKLSINVFLKGKSGNGKT